MIHFFLSPADSIAADIPRDAVRASRAVRLTGGRCITVDDKGIFSFYVISARANHHLW